MSDVVAELVAIGLAAGLDAVGVAPATPMERARVALEERKAAGLHAGMQFTYRNPSRSTDPGRLVPGARALVVGARRYDRQPVASPPAAVGRVARYAWRDHYAELRGALSAVAGRLRVDGHRAVVVADDNALVDREAAARAGLGWFGKSANLLLPGQGSWFVLGAVVTTAPLPSARDHVPDGCGRCRQCIDACPTGAIVAPGVVDARRCLAWLVQAPGSFPEEHRASLGDRLYGCDDCQEVCPPNLLHARADPARAAEADAEPWVSLLEVLCLDDETLMARFGRWYIPDRDPTVLRRNALVVLGNVGDGRDPAVESVLRRYLGHADQVLAEHARWAAGRLGRDDLG